MKPVEYDFWLTELEKVPTQEQRRNILKALVASVQNDVQMEAKLKLKRMAQNIMQELTYGLP